MADMFIDSYDWGNISSPWIGADIQIWDILVKNRPIVRYAAEAILFSAGDPFRDTFVIISGRIRHSVFSKDGQEKQLYIACPGALVGEISYILSKPHSMTAIAIVPTEVVRIPSKELQSLFHSDRTLADLMLQYEARISQMLIVQQANLSFDTAEVRVAKYLLYLCDRYGKVCPDGIHINLRFTCSDIAAIVGISRVTANNVLLVFQRQKILKKEDSRYIVVSIDQLMNMAEDIIDF